MVKNLSANTIDARDMSSISGLGRFSGGENSTPLQKGSKEHGMAEHKECIKNVFLFIFLSVSLYYRK